MEADGGEDDKGNESGGGSNDNVSFGLPDEVLTVLPPDPFVQLDIARKITSIALSSRVSSLESEAASLRTELEDKDRLIDSLHSQIESLDASLAEVSEKLAAADSQKEALFKENASLSNTVRKLNRDVSKLEVFRKTLMLSLQEDEEGSAGSQQPRASLSSTQSLDETSNHSSLRGQASEPVTSSVTEDQEVDGARPRIFPGLLLASQSSTPRFTPPGSPPVLSASASPTKNSKPASPRRHSVSFSVSRGMLDFSSPSPSSHGSFSSYDGAPSSGRPRVDGKEFFRQVRSRLSYEQFGSFLSNVKELNSHKQTKEATLAKAEEIFGPENKDLYTIFEGLLSRNH